MSLAILGICTGVAVVVAFTLRSRVEVAHGMGPSLDVVVVSSRAPVSPPARVLASHASQTVETDADATTIAPYRATVREALGLTETVIFRDVIVASARQHIVCGAISTNAGIDYQPFVYVGNAGIAALDDGSPDFREMQTGACGAPPSRR